MFELPECVTIAGQLSRTIAGKRVQRGDLGNSPHKFVWYNRKPAEFAFLIQGKVAGKAYARGRWLFISMEPGYVLVLGECGGKILYHPSVDEMPKKYHLALIFDDGSALSVTTQMWGAMELHRAGEEKNRKYIRDMRPTPLDPEFDLGCFLGLIDACIAEEKRSVKGLLTQDQLIPGLGNSIAQDILFTARLHPRHPLESLTKSQRQRLYRAIEGTVKKAIRLGGREEEYDLFNHPGRYIRVMGKDTVGKPCPRCGTRIEKIQYLGGACYYCPTCQT